MSRSLSKQTMNQLGRIADSISIGQANGHIGKTLAVASCHSGEGKSAVAAALAGYFADRGQRVLLIESSTSGASGKGEAPASSWMDLLRGGGTLPEATAESADSAQAPAALVRLPFGDDRSNFAQQGREMTTLLQELEGKYDLILFDLPSYFDHRLAGMVVSRVKDTLLIIRHLSTSTADIQQVRSRIERDGGRIAGVVMTRYKSYIPGWIRNLFHPARSGANA